MVREEDTWALRDWCEENLEDTPHLSIGNVRVNLAWIPPGRFWMGSPEDEEGRYKDEGPRHEVTLTQGFWMFETPVTQEMWRAVMDNNPIGSRRPIEWVSWNDCQSFITKAREKAEELLLALPTETQWEYACRAGSQGARYGDLDAVAWYDGNSRGETHPVGNKEPNAWGLYDMLGNVWEWCCDEPRDYSEEAATDPIGRKKPGAVRALRGGSYWNDAKFVRAANRNSFAPGFAFHRISFRCLLNQRQQCTKLQQKHRVVTGTGGRTWRLVSDG
jgi:formylglycine-generating enzyme required for sulfatase activity